MNELPARLLLVTDRHQAASPLEEVVAAALRAGTEWVWLRDRDMTAEARRELAARVLACVRAHGGWLSIGADLDLAAAIAADGIHLDAGAAAADVGAARALLGANALIGVSAHAPADVLAARAAGADYVTLSPIFQSASKPGYGPALGLGGLAQAARHALPVLALGGVTPQRTAECRRAGAAGIAVMGEFMRAPARPGGVGATVLAFTEALRVGARMTGTTLCSP